MKKYIMTVAVATLTLLSCQKELTEQNPVNQDNDAGELMEMTFAASMEVTSESSQQQVSPILKSYVNAADGFKVHWEQEDQITVYADNNKAESSFVINGEPNGSSASFSGTVASGASAYYAVYPASAAGECSNGKVAVTVPAVQTLSGNATASGALVTVAKASGNVLAFKNVCAILKVNISAENITEIILQGKNDEVIAGTVKVDAATGVLSEVVEGSKMITFKPSGATFATGDYYIALLPTTFTKGFDLVLSRSTDTKRSIKETSKQLTLTRSSGKNIGTVTADYAYEWVNVIMDKADINLFRAAHIAATTETWELGTDVDYQSATYTTPLDASDNAVNFKGIFDGRNHRIYNIKIVSKNTNRNFNSGFFNQIYDAVVKNLILGSKDGKVYDGVSEITNFTSYTGGFEYVGVVARAQGASSITNVVNFSKVTVTSDNKCMARVGGICGYLQDNSSISDCTNYGDVSNRSNPGSDMENNYDASMTGGVIGVIGSNVKTVSRCHNHGNVYNCDMNNHWLGGVFGLAVECVEMTDCDNTGSVIDESNASGCQSEVGGIVGRLDKANSTMTGCDNSGNVTVKNRLSNVLQGGVVGLIKNTGTITNCTNSGVLTQELPASSKYHALGGIVGFNDAGGKVATIQGCTVSENSLVSAVYTNVNSQCGVGGIIGIANAATLKNNEHKGVVKAKNTTTAAQSLHVGGIIGWNFSTACPEITGNTNSGSVEGESGNITCVGGICGISISGISNCYNLGAVKGTAPTIQVGTIAGNTNKTVTNCQSAGMLNGQAVTSETANAKAIGAGSGSATGCYFSK